MATRFTRFLTLIVLTIFMSTSVLAQSTEKIKGLSFVGSSKPISAKDVKPIIEMNSNWVTLMPYGFVGGDGKVMFNSDWQWWGEKVVGVTETVKLCQYAGLKIMLKPQIWMRNAYTGDFKLDTETDWVNFENSFEAFIMTFLDVAITHEIELFCIGTEWREFVKARPDFWNELIKKVRSKYKGEVIYAANWDDYTAVPFWDKMDYIGVNGYFPVSVEQLPQLDEITLAWSHHSKTLKQFSEKHVKQIIFTEIGYRSMTGATIKPWEHNTSNAFSEEIQSRAYKALFKVLWKERWFKGIFIWKWYHNHKEQGGNGDLDFTPQNKLAEKTIRAFWKEN